MPINEVSFFIKIRYPEPFWT